MVHKRTHNKRLVIKYFKLKAELSTGPCRAFNRIVRRAAHASCSDKFFSLCGILYTGRNYTAV